MSVAIVHKYTTIFHINVQELVAVGMFTKLDSYLYECTHLPSGSIDYLLS